MSSARKQETVSYPVGYNRTGHKLTLVGEADAGGRWAWSVLAYQGVMDASLVKGLSTENIRKIAAMVEEDGR